MNSIRARVDHVRAWLEMRLPDVLLIQELKGADFPSALFQHAGYHSAFVGQKTYNGVAVLSRTPLEVVSSTLPGDEADSHARYLETRIAGLRIVNVYSPNGNPPYSDKFEYKLRWNSRLTAQLKLWLDDPVPTIVAGDFNIIPEDIDCDKPENWKRDALFFPEPRAQYRAMLNLGYTDAFRSLHPGATGQFTYWDYFRQAFERNRGIRIDHFLVSPSAASRIQSCEIDRTPRTWEKPSDHTPVILTLAD